MLSKEKCDDVFQRAGSDMGLGFELFVFRASCFVLRGCYLCRREQKLHNYHPLDNVTT